MKEVRNKKQIKERMNVGKRGRERKKNEKKETKIQKKKYLKQGKKERKYKRTNTL